jgi:hypothetical protein
VKIMRQSPKGPPVRATLRDQRNTLGQRDLATLDADQRTPYNPPTEISSGYLATSSTMARSVIRAGARTANQQEEEAGTPRSQSMEPGRSDRLQGSVGGRPKPARKQLNSGPFQQYRGLRSTPDGRAGYDGYQDVSPGGERGLIDYQGHPRVGSPAQEGFSVPATPSGRVPWLNKEYVRDNASLYQWGWPAFFTHAVVVHPMRYIYARYRGGAPTRGLKSVSGVLANSGASEASRIHVPAVFVPQP